MVFRIAASEIAEGIAKCIKMGGSLVCAGHVDLGGNENPLRFSVPMSVLIIDIVRLCETAFDPMVIRKVPVMKNLLMLLLIFILSGLSLRSMAGVQPSAEDLRKGADGHFKRYSDYEFVYQVRSKNPQGVFENTQNIFRLHIPEEGYPWQCIIIKKAHGSQQQIDRFMAFNGRETMEYDRSEQREGNWSKASTIAGYGWDRFLEDAYPVFLSTSTVGLPYTNLSPHAYESFWDQQKERFLAPTEQAILDGYDVLVYHSTIKGCEIERRYLVNGPYNVLVGVYVKDLDTGKVSEDFKVESVGEKDGIVFPKKGHLLREMALAEIAESKYQGTDYIL